jgi:polysaccharide export outer membrane protein
MPKHTSQTCLAALAVVVALAVAGCALGPTSPSAMPEPAVPVARELEKVSLPRYVIEPPDILLIDALRVVPKDPFRIEPLDILYIDVEGTFTEAPIEGPYPVEPGGAVDLGSMYGKVNVANLSLEEAADAVTRHLERVLRSPQVSVTLFQSSGQQQIAGEKLVAVDGTVNLGVYGKVYVAGMTLEEATQGIKEHLSRYLEETLISVSVLAYNSKAYYVITQGAGLGDNILKFPVTGNETVLDALAQINGLSARSSKNIWIARPAPETGCFQVLPVDWNGIVRGGKAGTNYQIMPGDRVFIEQDHLLGVEATIVRLTAPVQKIFEFTLFGADTIQNMQRFPGGFTQ